MIFEYIAVSLTARPPQPALAKHLASRANAIKASGGTVLAHYAPQLGFAANEAVVLILWNDQPGDALGQTPLIATRERALLTPTLRPLDTAPPRAGGITVHRWFTVAANDVDTFLSYTKAAWPFFEDEFDTQIYGLFLAEESDADRAAGARRLLLMTRYASHAVWEASRQPSDEARAAFAARAAITRHTVARSSVLVT